MHSGQTSTHLPKTLHCQDSMQCLFQALFIRTRSVATKQPSALSGVREGSKNGVNIYHLITNVYFCARICKALDEILARTPPSSRLKSQSIIGANISPVIKYFSIFHGLNN